jgi:DNA-binding NarL/FixJ family response regulator
MGIISVLVVEPDPLRLKGIVTSLERETGFKVTGAGSDFIEALKAGSSPFSTPDVLIINIDHQLMKRMKSWVLLRALLPDIRVVALTKGEEGRVLEAALAAGFRALHPTGVDPDVLCNAVRNAAKGAMDYNPELSEKIKRMLMMPAKENKLCIGGLTVDPRIDWMELMSKFGSLTQREKQTMTSLVEGMTNRQIAQELEITVRTVEFHVSNILRKLNVSSRMEAGLLALWIQSSGQET